MSVMEVIVPTEVMIVGKIAKKATNVITAKTIDVIFLRITHPLFLSV